jgi:hypothetical protein
MDDTAHIRPLFAIFCDDIRREVSGKQILIGVYTGDIVIPSFPATIAIAGWIAFARADRIAAEIPIEFRIIDSKGQSLGYGSAILGLIEAGHDGAITLPALPVMIQNPGTITLQLKQYDEPWQNVRSVGVIGPISDATSPARPASQSPPDAPQEPSPPAPSRRERLVPPRRS